MLPDIEPPDPTNFYFVIRAAKCINVAPEEALWGAAKSAWHRLSACEFAVHRLEAYATI